MDEVELDLPEETKEPSSPTPVPATETAQNVPATPYPIVYLTMKSTDGTDVQVPYLNTPNGLVPWITQAPQQVSAQISEAKRTVEEGNVVPFVPQVNIVEQKRQLGDNVSGALAKKVIEGTGKYLYVKHGIDMYKITIPSFKTEYGSGGKVRVYFIKGGCYEQSEHYFIILEPLLIESLKVNVV